MADGDADLKKRVESMRCKKCGGKMIVRYRKTDGRPFAGCLRFPKCKGSATFDSFDVAWEETVYGGFPEGGGYDG